MNLSQENWTQKNVLNKYLVENKLLGKGQYSSVYRAKLIDQQKLLAAKVIEKSDLKKKYQNHQEYEQVVNLLKMESEIQMRYVHPSIVRLYDVCETPNRIYFFLEYCSGGDFQIYLENHKPYLSETDAINFTRQICEAFKLIFQQNVCHRDLKPANILMEGGQLKIGDFGFAKVVEKGFNQHNNLGSPIYMSPQALEQEEYDPFKHDIWSLGIMLYQMLYGISNFPWTGEDKNQLLYNIKKQNLSIPQKPERSDQIKQFLSNLLEKDEKKRFNWNQIFNHPLMLGSDKQVSKNPLLNSMNNNQVNTVKAYKNLNGKDFQVKKEQKVVQLEQENFNNSYINSKQRELNLDNMFKSKEIFTEIHKLVIFIVNKALFYKTIREAFYLSMQDHQFLSHQYQIGQIIVRCLFEKEFFILDNMCQNPDEFLIQYLNQNQQQYLQEYLNSDNFLIFSPVINDEYNNNCSSFQNDVIPCINQELQQNGFKYDINFLNCDQYLQQNLSQIQQNIKKIVDQAINQKIKTILILLLYLSLLINNEKELNLMKTKEELNRYIEKFNAMNQEEMHKLILSKWN